MSRILIEAQAIQNENHLRGIGRYVKNFLRAVHDHNPGYEIHYLFNGHYAKELLSQEETIRWMDKDRVHFFHPIVHPSLWDFTHKPHNRTLQKLKADCIRSIQPDFYLETSPFDGHIGMSITAHPQDLPCPSGAILYDFIPLQFSQNYFENNRAFEEFYKIRLRQVKLYDQYFAISQSTLADALRILNLPSDRVHTISSGYDPFVGNATPSPVGPPYFLYVGALDYRKNVPYLVEEFLAFSESHPDHKLAIAGNFYPSLVGDYQSRFPQMGDRVQFLWNVSDATLHGLYAHCEAFVFPSLYEGFGLPILEAASVGKLTLGASNTNIRELIEDPRFLFDPLEKGALRKKLQEFVESQESFRASFESNLRERLMGFTWDRVAENFWEKLKPRIETRTISTATQKGAVKSKDILTNQRSGRPALYVDVSELVDRDAKTGIQRVVKNVLANLDLYHSQEYVIHYCYLSNATQTYRKAVVLRSDRGVQVTATGEVCTIPSGTTLFLLDFQAHKVVHCKNLFYELKSRGVRISTLLYDLLVLEYPEFFATGSPLIYKEWLELVTEISHQILCISETTALTYQAYCDFQNWSIIPNSIRSIHLGSDFHPLTQETMLASTNGILRFLVVGTLEPRKGHRFIYRAFLELWKTGVNYELHIAGKIGWLVDDLIRELQASPHLGKNLFLHIQPSDSELAGLYATTDCVLVPSYGEGFGLPIVEAGFYGKPVIARDIPVFREIGSEHLFYFSDTPDETKVAGEIEDWVRLYRSGSHPDSRHIPQKSWKEYTDDIVRAIFPEPGQNP